ncbi:MAG: lipopolysaccharide biosynthesis protein [Akkermansia sp.]
MSQSLKKKTIIGLIWNSVENFASQGIAFAIGILIARMLSPESYGVVAMATVVFAIANVFVDAGFSTALIRKPDRTESDYCTVFYCNSIIGFVASFILFFSAPWIAAFYELPELSNIVRVMCWGIFLGSLGAVQITRLTINLDFKTQMKITVITTIASGLLGLFGAYAGWDVWALVAQMLCATLLRSILAWTMVRWIPRKGFSKQSFKSMFAFGSRLLASSLLNTINANLVTMLVGKTFSAATLGNYSRARHFGQFPSVNVSNILQKVTFPVLSSIQNDDTRLESAYRRLLKVSAFVIFPMMAGLSALAEPLILALLSDKWAEAIPLLQIMCFSLMFYPVHALNLNLLQVKGRSDLFLRLEIVKKILGLAFLFAALPMGIIILCYSRILLTVICWGINSYYTAKLIKIGFFKQILDLTPIILCSLVMWGSTLFIIAFFDNNWMKLGVGCLSGALIYIALAVILRLDSIPNIIDLCRSKKAH